MYFVASGAFVVSNHTTPDFKLRLSVVLSKMMSDPVLRICKLVCYAIITIGIFVDGIN